MRPRLKAALARTYRLTSRAAGSDSPVEIEPGVTVRRFVLEWSRSGPDEAYATLRRLGEWIDLEGASVLALGRGAGDLGIEAARQGARSVLALDMANDRLKLSLARLGEERDNDLAVELRPYRGHLGELGGTRFDLVLAADAFRRYGANPSSRHLEELIAEVPAHLEEGGRFAVAFGPPWKAPYGGGIDSRLPWAHLIVPETLIFDEFRRARPGNQAKSFDDIGINRITVARFRRTMRDSGLECVWYATNVSERWAAGPVRVVSRLPRLEEYLTQNVYGIWRRPISNPPMPRR
jgi:hypothetical protein